MSLASIREKERASQAQIDLILDQAPLTYGFLLEHISEFITIKFSLEPHDIERTSDLTELAAISLSRALNISKELVAEFEAGENCDGATSTDVKRTLLLTKIQKLFSLDFTLEELTEIEKIENLADVLWRHVGTANSIDPNDPGNTTGEDDECVAAKR